MKNSALLLFFLLLGFFAQAQQHKVDSLKALYPAADDTTRIKLLNAICWQYVYNETREALKYAKRSSRMSDSLNWMRGIAGSYTRLGVCYDLLQEYDSSLLAYDRSLMAGIEIKNDLSIGSSLNNMGLVYWNLGQYDHAIEHYLQSVSYFERIDNKQGIAHTYNNIGLILFEQGDAARALDYHEKALALRTALNDKGGISSSLSNIALVLSEGLNRNSEARDKFREAIDLKTTEGDLYGLTIAYKNLATCLIGLSEYEQAIEAAQQSIALSNQVGSQYEKAAAYTTMARANIRLSRFESAKQDLDSASAVVQILKNPRLRSSLYQGYAIYHASQGNYREAYDWQQKLLTVNDSIFDLEKAEAIERSERIYHTERTARELAEERLKNEEKELLLSDRSAKLWVLSVVLVLVVAASVAFFLFFRQRAKSRERLRIIEERERGIQTAFLAAEKERQHIARELHDSIGQQLSGIKLALSHAPNLPANALMIADAIDNVTTDVRNLSHRMMSGTLEKLGIVHAIDHMLRTGLSPGGIVYSFESFGLENFRFDPERELSLFRVAQELVTNIIKHARATRVHVQLYRTNGTLVLMVEDNGQGISAIKPAGIGLKNIRTRLQSFGSIALENSPEGGTVVLVRIAL